MHRGRSRLRGLEIRDDIFHSQNKFQFDFKESPGTRRQKLAPSQEAVKPLDNVEVLIDMDEPFKYELFPGKVRDTNQSTRTFLVNSHGRNVHGRLII